MARYNLFDKGDIYLLHESNFWFFQVKLQLQRKTDYGRVEPISSYILISAEELACNNDEIVIQFRGQNLDKKDWFGKSDPFIEIYKTTENGEYVLVHKTEVCSDHGVSIVS